MVRPPSNLHSRLTLSYLAAIALILGGVYFGTFVVVYWQLRNQLGQFTMWELDTLQGLFFFASDGTLRLPGEKLHESDNAGGAYVDPFNFASSLFGWRTHCVATEHRHSRSLLFRSCRGD
jgi:hypothetical protein